jgi:hypothetical protein
MFFIIAILLLVHMNRVFYLPVDFVSTNERGHASRLLDRIERCCDVQWPTYMVAWNHVYKI